MFRGMRREKQLLSREEILEVMGRCTSGVLGCLGDKDYPYAVPLNYVYLKDKIYFHSAKEGHKMDALMKNPKVSFAVIDEDTIISEEYNCHYRSVIVFGKARITEGEERLEAFQAFVEKYSGDQPEDDKHKSVVECIKSHIVAIDVDHITGKEAIEFVKRKSS